MFSGGIDSYIAYCFLNKPQTVYFDIGVVYSSSEIAAIKTLVPSTIIDKSVTLHEDASAHVPYRNLVLALLANRYADKIYIAGIQGDHVSDKTQEAFLKFSRLMSELEGRDIKVESPFWEMSKSEIVAWYLKQGGSANSLLKTVSCYQGGGYCAECPSCFRKWVALTCNGIKLSFKNKQLIEYYQKRCEQNYYDKKRCKETLKAINSL